MTGNNQWDESLFGCFDDCETCLCGWCCAPCLFGQNAEKIDNSNCCLMCCAYAVLGPCYLCWLPHCMKREVLRQKYDLQEDPNCSDCPATCCCGPCALCQEARLLRRRVGQPGFVAEEGAVNARSVIVQPHGHY